MIRKTVEMSLIIIGVLTVALSLSPYKIALNNTDSLDVRIFLWSKTEKPLAYGDLVVFSVENPYYNVPFVKILAGLPGDKVSINERREVFVDDRYIGKAVRTFKDGREAIAISETVIPQGKYFFYTNHQRSYDSRYKEIGLVSRDDIMGIAYPLL